MKNNPASIISLKYDDMFHEVFACEIVRKQFLSDVLEIPLDSIRSAGLVSPRLWKRHRRQKLGILDIALELNDDTKINVELQIRMQQQWVKRQLFYLAKMYDEDLLISQNYSRLKKCISIGILDFNLLAGEHCHSVYRLRDEKGKELTDLWELHIIELKKGLPGDRLDDWIRLFHAESKEELEMLATKNKGLAEAVEIMKRMSLGKTLRYYYEAHLKAVRDRYGEDAYVRDQGKSEGIAQGRAEGIALGKAEGIALGKAEDILQLLEDLGEVPEPLKKRIQEETDLQVLSRWLKAAAKAETITEFKKQVKNFTKKQTADNGLKNSGKG